MLRHRFIVGLVVIALLSGGNMFAQCKIADLVAANKVKIEKPFKYDGFSYINVEFNQVNQSIKKEFTAFKGQEYSLLFATSGFDETVAVEIFDTKKNQLVTRFQLGSGIASHEFHALQSGSYTINYGISTSDTDYDHPECIVLLIGFSEK